MKLHALALCLIGTAATALPAAAGDKYHSTVAGERVEISRSERGMAPGTYVSEERMYFIGNLYPDLPPVSEVAGKVTEIVAAQQTEVVHLSSMRPAAQTAGFSNIVTVYDEMIEDHNELVAFGSRWLADHGYPVPTAPAAAAVADMAPAAGVEHQIQMHQQVFNEMLERRKTERSSTVRGMQLWAAASAMRHISWLRALDRDVDYGRKTVSARLQSTMSTDVVHDQLVERITIEDREIFGTTVQQPTVIEQVVEVPTTVERVVEVERIVEKPVEKIVERVVEKPVYVERIVEKPVYIQRSRVAGRRGTYRRPAK